MMPRKAMSLWLLVLLLAGLAGCGGSSNYSATPNPTIPSGSSHLAYASIPSGNTISGFRIDGSGNFTEVVGSPFRFNIDQSVGSLTEVLPRVATGVTPIAMTMTSDGGMLFVLNQISGSISVFSVSAGAGALTQVTGSPFPTAPNPVALAINPSGKFLYVVNSNLALVFTYTISAAGLLQPAGTPIPVGAGPFAIAVDPGGKFAYVANTADDTVSILAINSSTGALTQVVGSPFDTGTGPISIVVSTSGQFIYIADQGTNDITGYSIDSTTGFPTVITGSPFGINTPVLLVGDPNGIFIYVLTQRSVFVNEFSIDASTGVLTVGPESNSLITVPVGFAVSK
jgi:6-phosphogluconolactonase